MQTFDQYKQKNQLLWLGLASEGTRSHTPGWPSGFGQLALDAKVPEALVKVDWGQRCFCVVDFYELTGAVEHDHAHMAMVFEGVKGYHPHLMSPIQPGAQARRVACVTQVSPFSVAASAAFLNPFYRLKVFHEHKV